MDTDILTMPQAAAILDLKPDTVRKLLAKGKLPGRKVGKSWYLSRSQLESFIRGEDQPPAARKPAPAIAKPAADRREDRQQPPPAASSKVDKPAPPASSGSEDTRVCKVCGEEKPLTDKYFRQRSKDGRSWYLTTCRVCTAAKRRKDRPSQAKTDDQDDW